MVRRGTGTTTISNVPLNNLATGTVRIEAGTLQPSGGFAQSGVLSGTGTLTASFTNNGTLRPDRVPGGLTVSGNFTQGTNGRTELTLAGRDTTLVHRSLIITGSAALAGTLAINLQSPFDEAVDAAFEVVRYASRTGDFTSFEGLSDNSGYTFNRSFDSTAMQLTVSIEGDVNAPAPTFLPSATLGDAAVPRSMSVGGTAVSAAVPVVSLDKRPTNTLAVNYSVARGTNPPAVHGAQVRAGDSGVTLPTLLPTRTDALAPAEVVSVQLVPGTGYELGTTTEKRYVLAGSEFARWQASQFNADQLLAGAADPLADSDRDGESNALEFATGGQGRVTARAQTGGPVFEFVRRAGAVVRNGGIADAGGLRYLLETSSDLKSWKTTGEDVEVVSTHSSANPEYERVTVRLRGPAKFVRMKVLPTP